MTDGPRSGSYGDYLYALAFRVLHEDLVLQPRRASLFETETGGTDIENEAMHFGIAAALSGEEPVSHRVGSRAPAYGVDQSATAPQRQHTMDANERTNAPVTGQLLEGAARPAFSPGDEVIGRGTPGERNLPAMERALRTQAGYRPTAAPVGGLLTLHAALEERWQQRDATANVPSPVLGVAPPSVPSPVIHLHEKTVRAEAATPVRLATASLHQAVMMARAWFPRHGTWRRCSRRPSVCRKRKPQSRLRSGGWTSVPTPRPLRLPPSPHRSPLNLP